MEAIIELNENITKLYVIILCFKGKNISWRFYYVLIEWKEMLAASLKAK